MALMFEVYSYLSFFFLATYVIFLANFIKEYLLVGFYSLFSLCLRVQTSACRPGPIFIRHHSRSIACSGFRSVLFKSSLMQLVYLFWAALRIRAMDDDAPNFSWPHTTIHAPKVTIPAQLAQPKNLLDTD